MWAKGGEKMSDTFNYTCPHCNADVAVNADPIPETVTCAACGKEVAIVRDTFYAGEVFAGEV